MKSCEYIFSSFYIISEWISKSECMGFSSKKDVTFNSKKSSKISETCDDNMTYLLFDGKP